MSAVALERAPVPVLPDAGPVAPGLGRRLAARFALIAFGFYHLPLILNDYPSLGGGGFRAEGLSRSWGEVFGQVGLWVARNVFQLHGPMPEALGGDNGDTAAEYGRLLVGVVVAVLGAVVWAAADRRRPRAAWAEPALRVLLRYSIALGLASYAIAKLYPVQFPPLSQAALEVRVGELHPMRLLWYFMQYSQPYSVIAGVMELAVVGLLTFRRTATLGALLCLPVLTNVALMNFCYAVPVKLFSLSMVASAAVLVGYDARRILGAIGLGPVVPPPPVLRLSRRARIARGAVKLVLVGGVIVSSVVELRGASAAAAATPVSPVQGTWQVESFVKAGRELVPTSDPARWRRFVVDARSASIRLEDERVIRCRVTREDAAQRIALDCPAVQQDGALRWQLDGDTLRLDGTFDHAPITASLKRLDVRQLPLVRTTFQWTFD
jgi:hypothetical protein